MLTKWVVCPKRIRQVIQLTEFHTLRRVCQWCRSRPRQTEIAFWLTCSLKLTSSWRLGVVWLPLWRQQGLTVCTIASCARSLGCRRYWSAATIGLCLRGSCHLHAHLGAEICQVDHIQHVLKALWLALYTREETTSITIRYDKLCYSFCGGKMLCGCIICKFLDTTVSEKQSNVKWTTLTLKLDLVRAESKVVVNQSSLFARKHRKESAFRALASLIWPLGSLRLACSCPWGTLETSINQFWNLACLGRITAWNR